MPKIKNILIFTSIAAVFILIYIFFVRKPDDTSTLISESDATTQNVVSVSVEDSSELTQEFLSLLLSVRNIKLDDSLFFTDAFINLRDSSIVLTPDGNEGRPNPFAPIGQDVVEIPTVEDLDISDLDLDLDLNLDDLDL